MKDIAITAKGKAIRTFPSYCQFFVYVIDVSIKITILCLLAGAGITHEVFSASNVQLNVYISLYLAPILGWGLLLVKFLLAGKGVFSKTRFDLYFMGMLFFSLITILLSENKVRGILGATGTWSMSIMTFMCMAVIFYAAVLVFRYLRGIKWLLLGYVMSILLPGLYYIERIFDDETSASLEYIMYMVITIPFLVSAIFIFRKLGLKIITFASLLISLFLTSYYSNFLGSSIFLLSIGVLSLFVLFYFSFWIKSSQRIFAFLKQLSAQLRKGKQIREFLGEHSTDIAVLVMIVLMAGWIIGFASFTFRYYDENIGPYLIDWVREDLRQVSGFGMLLFGDNDLNQVVSSMEWINVLVNYGLIVTLLYIALQGRLIWGTAKLTLTFLYKSNWKNIVLSAALFVMSVSLLVSFFLIRFTPFLQMLLVLLLATYTVIQDLVKRQAAYSLLDCRANPIRNKYLRLFMILVVLAVMSYSLYGILSGIDAGVFYAS